MLKGETKSGFPFEVDETVADDMELLEALNEADKDLTKLPDVLNKILGPDQKKSLYDHVRDDKGKVSITVVSKEFIEILNTAGSETKNS